MTETRVGFQIRASTPPAVLASVAAEAEVLGAGEIWLAENYFELGGMAGAATVLAATDRTRVGLGVVAAAARHPAVTAMEFATLGGAHPGRFMAGIGHGAPHWVRQMGLETGSPLRSLREAVGAIRRLLAGDELTRKEGGASFDGVRLHHLPSAAVPLYLGVAGPESLRLSGELADGTLLGRFSSPGYVDWARRRIEEGRARSGREDPHQLVVLCLLSLSDDDPAAARSEIAEWAAPLLAAMKESPLLAASPIGAEITARLQRDGAGEPPPKGIPDSLLGQLAAAGDTAECAATIGSLIEAGADRVVLVPSPARYQTADTMIELIRAAAPLFRIGAGPG